MVKEKTCRKCQEELTQIDLDIHPRCARQEEMELKTRKPHPESEFDRALARYPYSEPDDAA